MRPGRKATDAVGGARAVERRRRECAGAGAHLHALERVQCNLKVRAAGRDRRVDADGGTCSAATDVCDREALGAGETQGLGTFAWQELQWQNTHADEVGTVDALVGLCDDGAHTEHARALGGPVAG